MGLVEYVLKHTERNACTCGKCLLPGEDKKLEHSIDMFFFEVSAKDNPDAETLKKLTEDHKSDYPVNPLDGSEHSYIEIGGWIGDQGIAMQYMALGKLLGLWSILTPSVLGLSKDNPLAQMMAGSGFISIAPILAKEKKT